jgi:asparagine synthase (glutamine-hydrolysing)
MGLLAAAVNKTGEDVSPILLRMLSPAISARGESLWVATDEGTVVKKSLDELEAPGASAMLGYATLKIEPLDPAQPLSQHGYSFVFDGRLWHNEGAPDVLTAADALGRNPEDGVKRLIREMQGSYAIAALDTGGIHFGRDPMGIVPIYYAESSDVAAVATCRKMLWTAGLEANSFPPGHVGKITEAGVSVERIKTLDLAAPVTISMDDAVDILDQLLTKAVETMCRGLFQVSLGFSGGIDSSLLAHTKAVETMCRGLFQVSLGFSGGIDSSLLAHYLDKAGADVDLVCVGMEGSKEFTTAERAADSLDLSLRMESFTQEDVEADLDAVLWAIEEPDPMKTAVALPLYWVARIASDSGSRVFFSGNGSDELFGGYRKYVTEYVERGETVRETMYKDVAESYDVNYERDHKICMEHGMELRLPFADLRLVEYGLSLPTHLKLSPEPDSLRKLVLRRLAEKLGFPGDVANKPKRAVQYSTGVNNALRKLAKREGKSLPEFLRNRFDELKKERLGD